MAESVAVVTGAGAIGEACVRALTADVVVCVDRSAEQLELVVRRLESEGRRVEGVVADAADPGFGATVARAAAAVGDVTAAVHAIAFEEHVAADRVEPDTVLRSFRVGPLAALSLFREVKAVSVRPSFVAMGSLHATLPFADCVGYNAAHAALRSVVETLAHEWAGVGVRVNAVAPGWIRTDGEERLYGAPHLDAAGKRLPMGAMGRPEQVADAVAFLASPAASYVSGTVLTVDGALTVSLAALPGPGSR
jgi:NAD(P)-dependent dehydrogenase (short-subunit alcohol dehydrogenase family)